MLSRKVGASLIALGIAIGSGLAGCRAAAGQSRAIAITHVSAVDGRSPSASTDQTVVVQGTRIAEVGPAGSISIPTGAIVVDGRGRYLIPGLWDMHVHLVMPGGKGVLPLYLANGVTAVRDMAGDWATLVAWRRQILEGNLAGPRIVASGPYLEGGDVPIPHLLVRSPADAGPAVDSLLRLGVDFIKVHSQLSRESYFAIARAARDRGIPFVGHVPRSVGAIDASDSGQRSIEHLLTIPNQCTPADSQRLTPRFSIQSALGRCSSDDPKPLYATLMRNGTWVDPTLVAQYELAIWPTHDVPGDAFASYLPDSLRRYVAEIFPMPPDIPPNADSVGRALFDKRVAVTGELFRAGVHLLAGTDAPLRNSPPGFGLHQELGLFVRAGLSPFEVLRIATLEPARFFGALDSLGTVERGKLADLVLLEHNPLVDIANASQVLQVMAHGQRYCVARSPQIEIVACR